MKHNEMRDRLVKEAQAIRQKAYAPYSQYAVGAALLSVNDELFVGVNVENASYGLSICAERTAVFALATHAPTPRLKGIAICTENGGSPCGACRQVLVEFADGDIPVWLCDSQGNLREFTLYQLLPAHFGPEHLG